jgi:hypothetical protein
MAYETLTGLAITIPTNGQKNWGTVLRNSCWVKIADHRHLGSGDGHQLVTGSYTDYSVTTIKLSKNIGRNQASTLTPAGTTQTVNFNDGSKQILDLSSATGDVTLTLSNPVTGGDYRIKVVQGATPRDLIWPASVKWAGGVKPVVNEYASSIHVIWLDYDGSIYIGDWEVNFS